MTVGKPSSSSSTDGRIQNCLALHLHGKMFCKIFRCRNVFSFLHLPDHVTRSASLYCIRLLVHLAKYCPLWLVHVEWCAEQCHRYLWPMESCIGHSGQMSRYLCVSVCVCAECLCSSLLSTIQSNHKQPSYRTGTRDRCSKLALGSSISWWITPASQEHRTFPGTSKLQQLWNGHNSTFA